MRTSPLDRADRADLATCMAGWAGDDPARRATADTVVALATAGIALGHLLRESALAGEADRITGTNAAGDAQRQLDVEAHDLVLAHLRGAPVAVVLSEEGDEPVELAAGAPVAVAVDPLDGSANVAANAPAGMVFSLRPAAPKGDDPEGPFHRPGREQLGAGCLVFGPTTQLLVSVGEGTARYVLDEVGNFRLLDEAVRTPAGTREFAVNAANVRHWPTPLQTYVADLVAGSTGLRGADFSMRWLGALVAEALRIVVRGGIYLYPADARPGYRDGRLRLVYEGHPIAMLVEQAGGAATDGRERLLDHAATTLHQRTPLVFGSADKVARVGRYLTASPYEAERSPLFKARGLFRS